MLDVCEGGDAVDAEAEHLHVPQPRDDRDVGELGAPAVELLDLVHVTDPRPRHDHVLTQFHHGHQSQPGHTHKQHFCNKGENGHNNIAMICNYFAVNS